LVVEVNLCLEMRRLRDMGRALRERHHCKGENL
jgi:hypothetical protein